MKKLSLNLFGVLPALKKDLGEDYPGDEITKKIIIKSFERFCKWFDVARLTYGVEEVNDDIGKKRDEILKQIENED